MKLCLYLPAAASSSRLRSDVATVAQGYSYPLEGVVAEKVDLVIGVIFISCNGSPMVALVLYSA